jgi:predicted dehydrogenase
MRPLRVGIVGLGMIARYYVAALRASPDFRLVAVADIDDHALAPFRGEVACHPDHRAMLESAAVDAVVVTVPNDAHTTVCRDVIEAGLPVCVEKPLATRRADAEELARLADRRGVTLLTAFHRRYNSAVVAMQRQVRARRIESMTVHYLERIEDHIGGDSWYLDPTRCGGGCVADNGPNAYDLARLFLGEVAVGGASIERDAGNVDRRAEVVLRSAKGSTVRISLDWSYDGERKEVEVRLEDGTSVCADMLQGHAEFKGSLWHEYVGVLRAFAAALSSGRERGDDGLAVARLVEDTYAMAGTTRGGGS